MRASVIDGIEISTTNTSCGCHAGSFCTVSSSGFSIACALPMHAAANDSVAAMDAVRRLILMSPPLEIYVVWGDCRSTKNRANAETGKACVPIWDIGSLAERDVGRVLGYARCGCWGVGFVSRSGNGACFR